MRLRQPGPASGAGSGPRGAVSRGWRRGQHGWEKPRESGGEARARAGACAACRLLGHPRLSDYKSPRRAGDRPGQRSLHLGDLSHQLPDSSPLRRPELPRAPPMGGGSPTPARTPPAARCLWPQRARRNSLRGGHPRWLPRGRAPRATARRPGGPDPHAPLAPRPWLSWLGAGLWGRRGPLARP